MAKIPKLTKPFRSWMTILGLLALILWLIFFDSQSLMTRLTLKNNFDQLQVENNRLRAQIDSIEVVLKNVESAEMVEKIAREQYGMRRPGETVYRIDSENE